MAEPGRSEQGRKSHVGERIKRHRMMLGLSQADLGRLTGFDKSAICRWERGKEVPRGRTLKRLEAAFAELAAPVPGVSNAAEKALDMARSDLAQLGRGAGPREECAAETLWKRLTAMDPERRLAVVQGDPTYWAAGFCLRLCDESERAAARNASDARNLAQLARLVARKIAESQGAKAWRLRGFAEGLFANALKVGNDLHGAEAAFVRAWRLWKAGADGDQRLSEARLLDLEASLRWVLRYNQAACLCRLGKAEEAQLLVAEVRQLAAGNDLDLLRTEWLAAVVLSGLGQLDPAVEKLEQVCRALLGRDLGYDYALAGLDLALLYREQGRWTEIRGLAEEMVEIFKAEQIHRETLAALALFREAAVKQGVSAKLVRRLQEYLKQAQCQPGLRFEG